MQLSSRDELQQKFLLNIFKNKALQANLLPNDASFRRYYRVIVDGASFILMDCPPEHYSVTPFINMAEFLLTHEFSVPQIYCINKENGFLLLEDFGSISVSQYLLSQANPKNQIQIYKLIIDILVKLQSLVPPPDLNFYSNELLLKELELFTDWYIFFTTGKPLKNELKLEFLELWEQILKKLPNLGLSTVLRDYHAENMMVLNNQEIIQSIGLLDFQDAIIGSPVYDLVSVLEDARVELPQDFMAQCFNYYLAQNPRFNKSDTYLGYNILGAQRNSRIAGVFARKALRDGQQNYIKYLPWVLNLLKNDLRHENLKSIKLWMEKQDIISAN